MDDDLHWLLTSGNGAPIRSFSSTQARMIADRRKSARCWIKLSRRKLNARSPDNADHSIRLICLPAYRNLERKQASQIQLQSASHSSQKIAKKIARLVKAFSRSSSLGPGKLQPRKS